MARMRTIKPGFFKNEALADLPPLTRLLFAGLWTEADRDGRLEDRPRRLRAELLPYDDCDVDAMLEALAQARFIVRYSVDGQPYIAIPTFTRHQNPHIREAASTIPAPDEHSASTGRAGSARVLGHGPWDTGISVPSVPHSDDEPSESSGIGKVWAAYRSSTGRNGAYRLSEKRRRLILAALRAYTLTDVLAAVEGWRHVAHNRGENDRHTVYNDLELLLRDAEHIERFRDATLRAIGVIRAPQLVDDGWAELSAEEQIARRDQLHAGVPG